MNITIKRSDIAQFVVGTIIMVVGLEFGLAFWQALVMLVLASAYYLSYRVLNER